MPDGQEITKSSHISDSPDPVFIPLKEAERISGYAKDYIGSLCRAKKIVARRDPENNWLIHPESLLTHKATTVAERQRRMRLESQRDPLKQAPQNLPEIPKISPEPRLVQFESWDKLFPEAVELPPRLVRSATAENPESACIGSFRPREPVLPQKIIPRRNEVPRRHFAWKIVAVMIVVVSGFWFGKFGPSVFAMAEKMQSAIAVAVHQTATLAENIKDSPFLILKDYPLGFLHSQSALVMETLWSSLYGELGRTIESFPRSLGEKVGSAARSGDLMERIAQKFIPSSESVVLYPPPQLNIPENASVPESGTSSGFTVSPPASSFPPPASGLQFLASRVGFQQSDLDRAIADVNSKLQAESNLLRALIYERANSNFQAIALSNKIDTLSGITLSSVTGLKDSDIPDDLTASNYLLLSGGTITSDLAISGALTVSGAQTFSGALTIPYLSATSSTASQFIQASSTRLSVIDTLYVGGTATTTIRGNSATSTFAGGMEALQFASWNWIEAPRIMATSTTATSTFAFAIASSNGDLILHAQGTTNDLLLNPYGGNVGIGTTTPRYTFTVNSSNATDNLVQVATTTHPGIFVITNRGNVGIGTTSPQAKLTIWGGNANPSLSAKLLDAMYASSSLFTLYESGALDIGGVSSTSPRSRLALTSGGERMLQILNTGTVRLGSFASTSAQYRFAVNGSAGIYGALALGSKTSYLAYSASNGSVASTSKISDSEKGGPSGLDASDFFGRSVAAIGDLDGDGITDLAVGAQQDEASGTDGDGALHILFMNPDGTVKSTVKIADNVNWRR
ncbi:MAG: FG-GAP repeat protein [Candidatus Niyogibacteria bacterium]|nr:FG-GAP repeat protein [Candidatus Niyogibacteria bacterium]